MDQSAGWLDEASGPPRAHRPFAEPTGSVGCVPSESRRRNIKRSELRDLVLGAGIDLLLDDGVQCGVDQITFGRVFERVEETTGRRVTRASVYDRLWENQTAFQWDVLATIVERASPVHERTGARLRAVVRNAELTTADGRRRGLEGICHAAVDEHVSDAINDPHNRVVLAAMGAIASSYPDPAQDPPHVARVRTAVQTYLDGQRDYYTSLYGDLGYYLGYRLRDPMTLEQLVLIVHALGDGVAMRSAYSTVYRTPVAVDGRDGGPSEEDLTLLGIAIEAVTFRMCEPDPAWTTTRLTDGPDIS